MLVLNGFRALYGTQSTSFAHARGCGAPCLSQGVQGFLDKSDGRDKLLAAVQYAAMFASAGQPGDIKRIQVSVATARKVFRLLKVREREVACVCVWWARWHAPCFFLAACDFM